jgi:hypothetical protein
MRIRFATSQLERVKNYKKRIILSKTQVVPSAKKFPVAIPRTSQSQQPIDSASVITAESAPGKLERGGRCVVAASDRQVILLGGCKDLHFLSIHGIAFKVSG